MIEKNLIVSSESVISNITYKYSESVSNSMLKWNELDFSIGYDDLSLFNFKNNSNIVTIDKNTSYFLGDMVKLYYIFYPSIFFNFYYNNVKLESGFFITYQISSKDYENYRKNNFNSLEITPYYFNYPLKFQYIKFPEMNFKPFEVNLDPVPFFSSINLINFNLSDHWYTYFDYINLHNYNKKDIIRVPNICFTDEKLYLKEQSAPFTIYNRDFSDTKIFFTIGFKIWKSPSDLKDQKISEYFELLNMYDNSTIETLLFDFNNDHSFLNTNLTSKVSKNFNENRSSYYSFDNSRSTIFRLPVYFNALFRSGMDQKNKTSYFKDYNIKPLKVKDLLNFMNYYNVNYYFTSDSLFMIFIYLSNMYNFLASSFLDNIHITDIKYSLYNFSTLLCSNVDFYGYKNLLNFYKSVDCFSDQEMGKIDFYLKSLSGRNEIGYNMLPHCYCIPFMCLDLRNKTFIENFKNNKSKIMLSDHYIMLPDQCRIDFRNRFDDSIVNDFRFLGNRFKIGTNFSELVLLFTVSDNEKTQIYNIYTDSSISIRFFVLIIYSLLLIFSLTIFMIKINRKLVTLRKRIEYLASYYLEIINKDYKLLNLKELTPKEKILVNDLAKNILDIENQDDYSENDPINKRNLITLKKYKRRTCISSLSLNQEILSKRTNTIPDIDLENELKVTDFKDELEEIYSILIDNVDKFRVEFDFDKVIKYFNNYTDCYQNKYKKQSKIDYLFNYDEELTKEEFNLSIVFIKEISNFQPIISSKYSRNFLFKFALNYLDNNIIENLLGLSSENYQMTKTVSYSNYIISTQPFHDEKEYVEGSNVEISNKHCFFKSIYLVIDKHLSDLELSEFKIDFTSKIHVVSVVTYFFDNIFNKWLSVINQRNLRNMKQSDSQISYIDEENDI